MLKDKNQVRVPESDLFGVLPVPVLQTQMTYKAKFLYGVLRSFGPTCYAGLRAIGERASLSKPTLLEGLVELEREGWVKVFKEKGGKSVVEFVQLYALATGKPPLPPPPDTGQAPLLPTGQAPLPPLGIENLSIEKDPKPTLALAKGTSSGPSIPTHTQREWSDIWLAAYRSKYSDEPTVPQFVYMGPLPKLKKAREKVLGPDKAFAEWCVRTSNYFRDPYLQAHSLSKFIVKYDDFRELRVQMNNGRPVPTERTERFRDPATGQLIVVKTPLGGS